MANIAEIWSGNRHVVYVDGYHRDALTRVLASRPLTITFRKTNGQERTMRCTLQPEHLPPHDPDRAPRNVTQIVCVDVDKKAWRTFKIDRIIQIEETFPDGTTMIFVKKEQQQNV